MAVVTITVDTDSKVCKAEIDGVQVEDIRYASVYKYDYGVNVSIETKPMKNENGVTVYKSYSTYYDSHAKKMVMEDVDIIGDVEESISKFFRKK